MPPQPPDASAPTYDTHVRALGRIVTLMLAEYEHGVEQLRFYRDPNLSAKAKAHLPKLYGGSSNAIAMGLKLAELVDRVHQMEQVGKGAGDEDRLSEADCEIMEQHFKRRRELGLPLLPTAKEQADTQ